MAASKILPSPKDAASGSASKPVRGIRLRLLPITVRPFNVNKAAPSRGAALFYRSVPQKEYCGDILNFKTYSKSYKNKKRLENDRENWVIF